MGNQNLKHGSALKDAMNESRREMGPNQMKVKGTKIEGVEKQEAFRH
jgi:hypothetical protein